MNNKLDWLTQAEWTQGWGARNSEGLEVNPTDESAERWDLYGALVISYKSDDRDEMYEIIDLLKMLFRIHFPEKSAKLPKQPKLYEINDVLTFPEIKKLFQFI